MKTSNKIKTTCVIGGGPSGMMAAYRASNRFNNVILLEKNEKLGKKLFITGKGRCNVTNNCAKGEFFNNVVTNPKFLYSCYDNFSNFKRNVLDVAIDEINSVTEFNVSYDAIREQRKKKVAAIKFHISVKNNSPTDEDLGDISDAFCLDLLGAQECDKDYLDVYKKYHQYYILKL